MNPHLWVGLPGLATDIQTVKQKIEFRMNMYELKETRQMRPKTFANMVSNMLYERRFGPFFVEPIVAGLDPVTFEPYICNMDLIGTGVSPLSNSLTNRELSRLHHRAPGLRGWRDLRGAADGHVRDPLGAQDEARPAF